MSRRLCGSHRRYTRTERGAAAVEYALIAVLVAVVIIAAVTVFGAQTAGLFQRTCASMPSAGATTC